MYIILSSIILFNALSNYWDELLWDVSGVIGCVVVGDCVVIGGCVVVGDGVECF